METVAAEPVHRGRKPVISREQVLDAAAATLAAGGVDAVSLRAIARELGVVSSALYRHYPSRDALLADLAGRSCAALGDHVERAESSMAPSDFSGRLRSIVRGARDWAHENPREFALIYAAPFAHGVAAVPTGPRARVCVLLIGVLMDAAEAGHPLPSPPATRGNTTEFRVLVRGVGPRHPTASITAAAVEAWSQIFGHLGFEMFGHYDGIIADVDAYTDALTLVLTQRLGLAP